MDLLKYFTAGVLNYCFPAEVLGSLDGSLEPMIPLDIHSAPQDISEPENR